MPKIPKFKTEKEEAKFWATHSVADFWEDLEEPEKKIELSEELKQKILKRRETKKLLTIRLNEEHIESAKKIARQKAIGYQTLMRMWIVEGINKEKRPGI